MEVRKFIDIRPGSRKSGKKLFGIVEFSITLLDSLITSISYSAILIENRLTEPHLPLLRKLQQVQEKTI